MVDFIHEPCSHEKAFKELLQFLGKELSEAKSSDVQQWALNLYCVQSHYIGRGGIYCLAWVEVVEAINGCSPDPARPHTYLKTKAKIDELQKRVEQEEAKDEKIN